ncbi:guanine nucleotide-binding protein subunit gamma 2 isoform X2 [Gossypium raimondii]|uniref:G protein gamma domain-containing protein n=2 Tax=Gossypium TaxID=3633 RepID=A0A0D2VN48_GOSRA|nr:guanine nucleotide-binding protein subunit gamma 2 isoform X2 [Gossypium raimondii]KJB72255.1 hypothetical protein B456_011G167000 [Gossypium raimondii]
MFFSLIQQAKKLLVLALLFFFFLFVSSKVVFCSNPNLLAFCCVLDFPFPLLLAVSIGFITKEMQSGRPQSVVSPIPQRIHSFQAADTRGKHRIQAELKRLEQEARFLEEELELIERMEKASAACKEMFSNVESRPDPLLPITNGPINPMWDQWFEGPQEAQGCKCWIL